MLPIAADAATVAIWSPGSGVSSLGGNEGDYHLWGQDVSLITQETLKFGGGYDNGGAGYTVNFVAAPMDSIVPASNFGHRLLPELP